MLCIHLKCNIEAVFASLTCCNDGVVAFPRKKRRYDSADPGKYAFIIIEKIKLDFTLLCNN